jgi:RimJ/RimL family protein N-acetyltransferase
MDHPTIRGGGRVMELRRFDPDDLGALNALFDRLPEGDRTFFKEDVLDTEVVASWAHDRHGRRFIAVDNGAAVAYAAVIPGVGWSSHVGELRLVVDPAYRRRGVGTALAERGMLEAFQLGLHKLSVEVVADQTAAIQLFQSLGFAGEAILRDHVRDRDGRLHDLIVLAHVVDDNWALLATAGIEDAVS